MADYSILFVCLMGIGTVFFGLICIIGLCYAMSALIRAMKSRAPASAPAASAAAVPAPSVDGTLVAALSAAIAEDLGTDISAIRILSIRKV